MKRFLLDENAQTTVEYMLMLAFAVSLFILVFKGVLMPAMTKLNGLITGKIQSSFQGDNFYQFRFSH